MNSIIIMNVPLGFKIRRKVDIDTFINKCMNYGEYPVLISKDLKIYISKEKDGTVSVLEKRGDLYDMFNPLLEVANTGNNAYKKTVQDYIWKYRKYINTKWFND